ncbi:hypothetical protein K0M31_006736 [Melipona bicolor]|nr:hypothetical protein K0M31_006736 [Melipona bicolor]
MKSMIQRMLNTNDILIIDGSNYIKGYRYEIYCITKLYKTPQCIIFCDMPIEHAWLCNERRSEYEKYNREIFDALVMRYEIPDSKNRWDLPLFITSAEDELKFDEIYKMLYEVEAPKPNLSTQCPSLSSTNYLYELDTVTQEVINKISSCHRELCIFWKIARIYIWEEHSLSLMFRFQVIHILMHPWMYLV